MKYFRLICLIIFLAIFTGYSQGLLLNPFVFATGGGGGGGGGTITFVDGDSSAEDNSGASGPYVIDNLPAVQIGEVLVAWVGWEGTGTISAPAESLGTGSASTWTSGDVQTHASGEPKCRIFWTTSAQMSGAVTYTYQESGTCSYKRSFICSLSASGGTFQLDTLDNDNQGNSSGTLTSGNITTSGPSGGTIVFGFLKGYTALTFSAKQIGGVSATSVDADQSDTACWYRIATVSNGPAQVNVNNANLWVMSVYAFKVQ